jgi:hypothetical protein
MTDANPEIIAVSQDNGITRRTKQRMCSRTERVADALGHRPRRHRTLRRWCPGLGPVEMLSYSMPRHMPSIVSQFVAAAPVLRHQLPSLIFTSFGFGQRANHQADDPDPGSSAPASDSLHIRGSTLPCRPTHRPRDKASISGCRAFGLLIHTSSGASEADIAHERG